MAVSACSKPSDSARRLTAGWGRKDYFVPEMMQKRTFSAKSCREIWWKGIIVVPLHPQMSNKGV